MSGPPATFPVDNIFGLIAKEVTPGTPVAGVATLGLTKPLGWNDKPTWLPDNSLRGVMAEGPFGLQQGVTIGELTIPESPLYVDTFGYVLGNLFGDVVTTGSGAPYSTVFGLLNSASGQGTTHTITEYYGPTPTSGSRQFAATCFTEVSIMWDSEKELVTWSGKAASWMSTAASAKPTAAQSTVAPIPSWRVLMGLAGPASGGTQVQTCGKGKITFKRKFKPYWAGTGSQNPYSMQRGGLSASFSGFKYVTGDESVYNYMANNTKPQMQILIPNGLSGAAQGAIQIDAAEAGFKVCKPDYGSDLILWDASGDYINNTTNVGASGGQGSATVTLTNAVASGTYV
jgi:hypothetical protein